jgi:hypothetical protein
MGISYKSEVHQSPRANALSIYPYANYMSLCPIGWLKYSEIYWVTGARGERGLRIFFVAHETQPQ